MYRLIDANLGVDIDRSSLRFKELHDHAYEYEYGYVCVVSSPLGIVSLRSNQKDIRMNMRASHETCVLTNELCVHSVSIKNYMCMTVVCHFLHKKELVVVSMYL